MSNILEYRTLANSNNPINKYKTLFQPDVVRGGEGLVVELS